VRMPYLCKLEMSRFLQAEAPNGTGGQHVERTRTRSLEGLARNGEASD
jgi:hypothetical protein